MTRERIKKIIDKNGIQMQSIIAMEECAELAQAISKCIRSGDQIPGIVKGMLLEEMADVIICLEQLKVMYKVTDAKLNEWIQVKENRLLKREGL